MDFKVSDYTFLTTYRKHYVKKPFIPSIQHRVEQEFADPIAAGQKHYLYLQKSDLTPPDEDGEIYFDKFKQKHQHLKELLSKPLNTKLILDQEILNEKSSEYQAEFGDREKEASLYAKSKADQFRLADDSEIPLTTQNASFKDPLSYTPRALDPPIRIMHPDNLGYNERRNELLQVKTGVSEYMGEYNTFGEFILEQTLKNHLAKK